MRPAGQGKKSHGEEPADQPPCTRVFGKGMERRGQLRSKPPSSPSSRVTADKRNALRTATVQLEALQKQEKKVRVCVFACNPGG